MHLPLSSLSPQARHQKPGSGQARCVPARRAETGITAPGGSWLAGVVAAWPGRPGHAADPGPFHIPSVADVGGRPAELALRADGALLSQPVVPGVSRGTCWAGCGAPWRRR